MGSELLTSDPQRSIGSERWKGWISGSEKRNDLNHTGIKTKAQDCVYKSACTVVTTGADYRFLLQLSLSTEPRIQDCVLSLLFGNRLQAIT